LQNP